MKHYFIILLTLLLIIFTGCSVEEIDISSESHITTEEVSTVAPTSTPTVEPISTSTPTPTAKPITTPTSKPTNTPQPTVTTTPTSTTEPIPEVESEDEEVIVENITIEDHRWEIKAGEYPAATQVWLYMKDLGWNDAVCAGIMGNMMAETGGQTLNLNPSLYASGGLYYGICQWHATWCGEIHGASLEAQCDYLRDTIKQELDSYGWLYCDGMDYEEFLNMTSPSEAALCFAKAYERCASGTYSIRQNNADNAYSYFVG